MRRAARVVGAGADGNAGRTGTAVSAGAGHAVRYIIVRGRAERGGGVTRSGSNGYSTRCAGVPLQGPGSAGPQGNRTASTSTRIRHGRGSWGGQHAQGVGSGGRGAARAGDGHAIGAGSADLDRLCCCTRGPGVGRSGICRKGCHIAGSDHTCAIAADGRDTGTRRRLPGEGDRYRDHVVVFTEFLKIVVGVDLHHDPVVAVTGSLRNVDPHAVQRLRINIDVAGGDTLKRIRTTILAATESVVGQVGAGEDIIEGVATMTVAAVAIAQVEQAESEFGTAADNRPVERIRIGRVLDAQRVESPAIDVLMAVCRVVGHRTRFTIGIRHHAAVLMIDAL